MIPAAQAVSVAGAGAGSKLVLATVNGLVKNAPNSPVSEGSRLPSVRNEADAGQASKLTTATSIAVRQKWAPITFPVLGGLSFPGDRESPGTMAIRPLLELNGLAPPDPVLANFRTVWDIARARAAASAGWGILA